MGGQVQVICGCHHTGLHGDLGVAAASSSAVLRPRPCCLTVSHTLQPTLPLSPLPIPPHSAHVCAAYLRERAERVACEGVCRRGKGLERKEGGIS